MIMDRATTKVLEMGTIKKRTGEKLDGSNKGGRRNRKIANNRKESILSILINSNIKT